jgi:transposase
MAATSSSGKKPWIPPKTTASVGRPSKLTKSVRDKLTEAIELGCTLEDACNYAGITYRTFRNWALRAEQEKQAENYTGEFFQFFQAIKYAEGKMVVRCQAKIERAATMGDWHAAAWKLERRYPDRYGRTVQDHQVTGHLKVHHGNLVQSILSNPTAAKSAVDLVAALAGSGYSQDDPGGDRLGDESGEMAIGSPPEAD